MKRLLLSAVGFILVQPAMGQDSTETKSALSISGYVETYYNYDFNRPQNNTTPGYLYNFNRAGEVNLNLAFIKASYTTERVRANVALATGTYMNANYAAEPGVLKNIFEANIGVKVSKNSNLWLDAGVIPSHIGFESAIGKDNWALTRSMVAENSPYFETGIKLGFTSRDDKLYLAAVYLNGWQRIHRVDGNTTSAFGTQITYKPSSSATLNYSTFIGNDKPDSVRLMRYYNNFFGIFHLSEKLALTTGFDYGAEQKFKGSRTYNIWFVPVAIFRYSPSTRVDIAVRTEYFQDKKGVIIATGTAHGFQTWGFSANLDYAIMSKALWRIEARNFSSKDAIFTHRAGGSISSSAFLTTSLSVAF